MLSGARACRLCSNHPHLMKATGGSGKCEYEEFLE